MMWVHNRRLVAGLWRSLLVLGICCWLCLGFFLLAGVHAAGVTVRVDSYAELVTALEDHFGEDLTICVTASFTVPSTVELYTDITITADADVVLKKGDSAMFSLAEGSKLTLKGAVTLEGCSSTQAIIICQPGSRLVIGQGVILRNNHTTGPAQGGAVTVTDATCILDGGTIENCGVYNDTAPGQSYGGGAMGGAVRLRASSQGKYPAVFQLRKGCITGCFAYHGGAVAAESLGSKYGAQIMISGGTIDNCLAANGPKLDNASVWGTGSALFLYNQLSQGNRTNTDVTARIQGGTIKNCHSRGGALLAYYHAQSGYGGQYRIHGGTLTADDEYLISIPLSLRTEEAPVVFGGSPTLSGTVLLGKDAIFGLASDFDGILDLFAPDKELSAKVAVALDAQGKETTARNRIAGKVRILDSTGQLRQDLGLVAKGNSYYLAEPDLNATDPTEESTEVTEATTVPTEVTEPTTSPTEVSTPSTQATTAPTEASVPATKPTEVTKPTQATAPATKPTQATTPSAKPTQPATRPATEPTKATTPATTPTVRPTSPGTEVTLPSSQPTEGSVSSLPTQPTGTTAESGQKPQPTSPATEPTGSSPGNREEDPVLVIWWILLILVLVVSAYALLRRKKD